MSNEKPFLKRLYSDFMESAPRTKFGFGVTIPSGILYCLELTLRNNFNNSSCDYYTPLRQGLEIIFQAFNIPYDSTAHRYYAASFLGTLAWASFFDFSLSAQIDHSKNDLYNQLASLAPLSAILLGHETYMSFQPGRSFDQGDVTAYACAIGLYLLSYAALKPVIPQSHPINALVAE